MTVDPADIWAYATRPIADSDPNGPLLAVLRAADAAEPRVVRASRGAMVDGRFEVPVRTSSGAVPWSVRDQDGEEVGVIWSGPNTASITTNRPGCHVVKVSDPEEARRYGSPALPTPEQRTRRDVAAVIT